MTPEQANAWMVVVALGGVAVSIGGMLLGFFTLFYQMLKLKNGVGDVHNLVNSRSKQQDDKIDGLHEEVSVLKKLLAAERRLNDNEDAGNI